MGTRSRLESMKAPISNAGYTKGAATDLRLQLESNGAAADLRTLAGGGRERRLSAARARLALTEIPEHSSTRAPFRAAEAKLLGFRISRIVLTIWRGHFAGNFG